MKITRASDNIFRLSADFDPTPQEVRATGWQPPTPTQDEHDLLVGSGWEYSNRQVKAQGVPYIEHSYHKSFTGGLNDGQSFRLYPDMMGGGKWKISRGDISSTDERGRSSAGKYSTHASLPLALKRVHKEIQSPPERRTKEDVQLKGVDVPFIPHSDAEEFLFTHGWLKHPQGNLWRYHPDPTAKREVGGIPTEWYISHNPDAPEDERWRLLRYHPVNTQEYRFPSVGHAHAVAMKQIKQGY